MPDQQKDDEKKIIVDEDWKSRVEAEREAARPQPEEKAAESARAEQPPPGPLPPPDLSFLASSLYLQAMVSLGLFPNPVSEKSEIHLDQAKHTIDTLQMLQEKTEGNRTENETAAIDTMLHELRLAFVGVQQPSQDEPKTDDK